MRKKSTKDSIEQSQIQPSTQRPIKKSKTVKRKLRPSLFFFSFSVECVSWCWVGRSDWKKNHKKSRNRRPWYPRITLKVNIHITRLTTCTIYCKKRSCFCSFFFYFVTMLIFQIKRTILREKWFNYVVFFLFWKYQKFGLRWNENTTRQGHQLTGKHLEHRGIE